MMLHPSARSLATLGLLAVLHGCTGDESGPDAAADSLATDSASRQPAPARAPIVPPADSPAATSRAADTARSLPPSSGANARWDAAALEKRLDLQGMAPRKREAPVRHPFLSVPGTSYLLGTHELQVFIYPDSVAANRDFAALDTVAVAPRGGTMKWSSKPTLIRNNNLLAVLLGQNALQIERVQRALMAGLSPGG